MQRASEPFTPEIDLAAHRSFASTGSKARVLTPELEIFFQSGVAVKLAACGPNEFPIAGLGCGCRVLEDGRLRILLARSRNAGLLTIVERGGGFAVTFSRPYTHRSIQVKGAKPVIALAETADCRAAAEQCEALRRELVAVGYPPSFAAAYCHVDGEDIVGIDLVPAAAFVQTPGPGAGAELKP